MNATELASTPEDAGETDDGNIQQHLEEHIEGQGSEGGAVSPVPIVAEESNAETLPPEPEATAVEHPRQEENDAPGEKLREAPDWLPRSLSLGFMVFLILWDLVMIVVLLALTIVSSRRQGISTIQSAAIASLNSSTFSLSSAYGLLWTSLPSLILSLYNLSRGLSVAATGVRQPYVTLWRKPDGAPARKTIFLDYQFQGGILGARRMLRNRHWSILAATLLSFLTSVAIIPLSSHVLEVRHTSFNSTVQVQYNSSLNETIFDGPFNLLGALDIASAVIVYQAAPPPWMDRLYAFRPFTLSNPPINGSVTVETTAYSAVLDCRIITPDQYLLDSSGNFPNVKFTDRGCSTSQYLNNDDFAPLVFLSFSEESCTIEAQFSRIGLLAASYNNASQSTTALCIVSCEPSYWQVNGSLTVSLDGGSEPLVSSFRSSSPWDLFRPTYWKFFESYLVSYAVIDQTRYISGDELGRKVYGYAQEKSPQNILDPETLKGGLEDVFTAVHAGFLKTNIFTATPPTSFPATLTTPEYRLFVVAATAAVILCFMLFNLLCNIWLLVRSRRYPSILAEEPRGLIATTALAYDSRPDAEQPGIYSAIQRFKGRYPDDNAVREKMEKMKKHYDVDNMVCYFDQETWTIRLRNFPRDDDEMTTSTNLTRRQPAGTGSA
jgi:hypothetical protein